MDPSGLNVPPFNPGAPYTPTGAPADYELLSHIGRGSYGDVWLARDRLGIFWAVKIVYHSSFDSDRPYEREFEGVGKYVPVSKDSAHLLKILHVGRRDAEGCFYYLMELADDLNRGRLIEPESYVPKTLKNLRRPEAPLSCDACLTIALPLTDALIDLHRAGLIHRDVKPANIIFVNGHPKLADLGLVTAVDASMSFVGAEGFIPPEGPTSPQADIYALGKVLYELMTGRDRLDYPEVPTNLDERPDHERLLELNEIVKRACHYDPARRYQTALELHGNLSLVAGGGSVRGKTESDRRWRTRRRVGIASGAMAAVAAGLVFAWPRTSGPAPTPTGFSAELTNNVAPTPTNLTEVATTTVPSPLTEAERISPDEASRNYVLGRKQAFLQDNWESGVALLAQGSDAALRKPAVAEVHWPTNNFSQVELARFWLAAAGKAQSIDYWHCCRRARHWYREAIERPAGPPSLIGGDLLQAELARVPTLHAVLKLKGTTEYREYITVQRDRISWKSFKGSGPYQISSQAATLPPFRLKGRNATQEIGLAPTRLILPEGVDFTTARLSFTSGGKTSFAGFATLTATQDDHIQIEIGEKNAKNPHPMGYVGSLNYDVTIAFGQ